MNTIDRIQKLQRDVYNAHARTVEIETRERGWDAMEAADADVELMKAIAAYESELDCKPEYGEDTGLVNCGKYPLYKATTERIMQICGEDE
jgi:hypothetical protein